MRTSDVTSQPDMSSIIGRWLDRDAAAEALGLTFTEFKRLRVRAGFPEPSYYLGPKSPRWDRLAIQAWMTDLIRLHMAGPNDLDGCPMRSRVCPRHKGRWL